MILAWLKKLTITKINFAFSQQVGGSENWWWIGKDDRGRQKWFQLWKTTWTAKLDESTQMCKVEGALATRHIYQSKALHCKSLCVQASILAQAHLSEYLNIQAMELSVFFLPEDTRILSSTYLCANAGTSIFRLQSMRKTSTWINLMMFRFESKFNFNNVKNH